MYMHIRICLCMYVYVYMYVHSWLCSLWTLTSNTHILKEFRHEEKTAPRRDMRVFTSKWECTVFRNMGLESDSQPWVPSLAPLISPVLVSPSLDLWALFFSSLKWRFSGVINIKHLIQCPATINSGFTMSMNFNIKLFFFWQQHPFCKYTYFWGSCSGWRREGNQRPSPLTWPSPSSSWGSTPGSLGWLWNPLAETVSAQEM